MRALALSIAALCLGQEPAAYRADVRLVNVAFSVRDSRGLLITDLGQNDFEVLDDGTPQKISFFAKSSDLPLSLGLVVDLSGSQQKFVKRHERDLKQFLKRVLKPKDQAFVVGFGNRIRLLSDFSASPAQLTANLDLKNAVNCPDVGPRENRILGTAFYDAIYHSVKTMLPSAVNGRRALIAFSDGEDNSSAYHMLDAIETAQADNVVIYSMRYTEAKADRWNARNKYGKRVLERISRDTGGADYDAGESDINAAFRSIDEDLRSGYELAYHSPASAGDGTFHKITVRAKRPGLTVRAKTGYFSRQ